MNVESGFLGGKSSLFVVDENQNFSDFHSLSTSRTGFFRILVGKHLGRKVVIKTLKEEEAHNPVAITQLKKEFSALFPLSSPNVVQVFRMTKLEDGTPAIEMEWCDGTDIRELLNSNLSSDDVVQILGGVLGGLRDIHQIGIVHRDIKPENVMYDPFRKVVKIIDFGCAYLTGALSLQGPNGTPDYTPEDKTSVGSEAEPKDDLYALGIMIGEMIENMTVGSKKDISFIKKLKRFSDILIEGGFEKTENAIEAFEKIIKKRRDRKIPLLSAFALILITLLFLSVLFLSKSHAPQEISSIETLPESKSDSLVYSPAPTVMDNSESQLPISDLKESKTEQQRVEPELDEDYIIPMPKLPEGTPINPYSGISSEDEATYELAIVAGKLLRAAGSKRASIQVRMDAFVIKFVDSIYLAEGHVYKFPKISDEDDRRVEAKKLADQYKGKMEQAFRKSFGDSGDSHRREVLLEGRWYLWIGP